MRHATVRTLRIIIALCLTVSVLLLASGGDAGHGHAALFLPVLAILLFAALPAGRCRLVFDAPPGPAPARIPSLPRSPPV